MGAAAPSVAPAPVLPAEAEEARRFAEAKPLQRVQELYESESRRVGQVDPDPELTQRRLETLSRLLGPDELRWLGEQALGPSTGADARFFATYLLGLSGSAGAVEPLARIALRPVPSLKNERLVAEIRIQGMQATEALSRFCDNQEARDALLDVVSRQADEAIADRAHRALHACVTGQPVEEQDKEALRKLRERGQRR